jgi:hypothetical protein
MENIIGNTGGDAKDSRWPHPMNDKFNDIIKSVVNIYGIGQKTDVDLLKRCKEYLKSRVKGLVDHKITRETEEYYRAINLKISHGIGKSEEDQQKMIEDTSMIMCVGNWADDEDCLRQYRAATLYSKPIYEMRYEPELPLDKLIRYLQPVRPIKDESWDPSKQDELLVYETREGLLEVIDGNHRHEFANRVGGVDHLAAWVIKEV